MSAQPAADEVVFDVLAFPDQSGGHGLLPRHLPVEAAAARDAGRRMRRPGHRRRSARSSTLKPGDLVINLQRENWAQKRKVKGDDAIPLPAGIDLKRGGHGAHQSADRAR